MKTGIMFGSCLILYLLWYLSEHSLGAGPQALQLFAVMMAVLSTSMLVYTARDMSWTVRKTWPTAMGRIEGVKVTTGFLKRKKIWLTFNYDVMDRSYSNGRFDFMQEFAWDYQLKAHPDLSGYRDPSELVGRLVKVYYDRESPWKSALSRRMENSQWVSALPGLIVIGFCLIMLLKVGHKLLINLI